MKINVLVFLSIFKILNFSVLKLTEISITSLKYFTTYRNADNNEVLWITMDLILTKGFYL